MLIVARDRIEPLEHKSLRVANRRTVKGNSAAVNSHMVFWIMSESKRIPRINHGQGNFGTDLGTIGAERTPNSASGSA
jgi:hypothetical protein